ncbi:MAG: CoA pyrophosphatase, partial [Lawsonibacter sp.]|nr:CoA pyrophosphatase [Lawsonibacter sp.]
QNGRENVPVYPWEGRAIWGLTGRITRNLISLLQ